MKMTLWTVLAAVSAFAMTGCSTPKLPSEDIEVPVLYADAIAVLKSNLPANSREKYEAAKYLLDKVDFSFTREVQTLDKIFNPRDAFVDRPKSAEQMIMFYFQYKNKSVRFCFYRYIDVVTKVEIIENGDARQRRDFDR